MDSKKQIDPLNAISWLVGLNLLFVAVRIFQAIDRTSHSVSDTLINFVPVASVLALAFILFRRYMTKFSRCPFCFKFHKIGDACLSPKKKSSD